MRIPDFFVIGASKCGTTALSEYLRQHPSICFSRTKEPHYFSDDFPSQKMDMNLNQYWRRNFSYFDARKHRLIGEGSGTYYISDVAVPNILKANPSAKFIYLVRNPVDMVYSFYGQLRFFNAEDASGLEEAWALQGVRQQGLKIPTQCPEPRFLQYRTMASLGHHLAVLNSHIPTTQMKVIVFDDFIRDPKKTYEDVLKFIGVDSDGREIFPVVNESRVQRSRLLGHVYSSLPRSVYNAAREFKHLVGISHASLNLLAKFNSKSSERPPLAIEFRKQLIAEFESDLQLLERQLGCDLPHWRQ